MTRLYMHDEYKSIGLRMSLFKNDVCILVSKIREPLLQTSHI